MTHEFAKAGVGVSQQLDERHVAAWLAMHCSMLTVKWCRRMQTVCQLRSLRAHSGNAMVWLQG